MHFRNQVAEDISRCQSVLESADLDEAAELVELLVNVYANYIKDIHAGVSCYGYGNADYLKDIKLLKKKLEILFAEVKDGKYPNTNSKVGFVLNNNSINNNKNHNSIHNDMQSNIEVAFTQIKEEILCNDALSQEETEEIIEIIKQIEEIAKSSKTKKEKWKGMRTFLSWLGTKGVDIGLKILPLIIASLK